MNSNDATPKLLKLVHIEPDTIPDAGDYNALVDVVNAMAELVEIMDSKMGFLVRNEKDLLQRRLGMLSSV